MSSLDIAVSDSSSSSFDYSALTDGTSKFDLVLIGAFNLDGWSVQSRNDQENTSQSSTPKPDSSSSKKSNSDGTGVSQNITEALDLIELVASSDEESGATDPSIQQIYDINALRITESDSSGELVSQIASLDHDEGTATEDSDHSSQESTSYDIQSVMRSVVSTKNRKKKPMEAITLKRQGSSKLLRWIPFKIRSFNKKKATNTESVEVYPSEDKRDDIAIGWQAACDEEDVEVEERESINEITSKASKLSGGSSGDSVHSTEMELYSMIRNLVLPDKCKNPESTDDLFSTQGFELSVGELDLESHEDSIPRRKRSILPWKRNRSSKRPIDPILVCETLADRAKSSNIKMTSSTDSEEETLGSTGSTSEDNNKHELLSNEYPTALSTVRRCFTRKQSSNVQSDQVQGPSEKTPSNQDISPDPAHESSDQNSMENSPGSKMTSEENESKTEYQTKVENLFMDHTSLCAGTFEPFRSDVESSDRNLDEGEIVHPIEKKTKNLQTDGTSLVGPTLDSDRKDDSVGSKWTMSPSSSVGKTSGAAKMLFLFAPKRQLSEKVNAKTSGEQTTSPQAEDPGSRQKTSSPTSDSQPAFHCASMEQSKPMTLPNFMSLYSGTPASQDISKDEDKFISGTNVETSPKPENTKGKAPSRDKRRFNLVAPWRINPAIVATKKKTNSKSDETSIQKNSGETDDKDEGALTGEDQGGPQDTNQGDEALSKSHYILNQLWNLKLSPPGAVEAEVAASDPVVNNADPVRSADASRWGSTLPKGFDISKSFHHCQPTLDIAVGDMVQTDSRDDEEVAQVPLVSPPQTGGPRPATRKTEHFQLLSKSPKVHQSHNLQSIVHKIRRLKRLEMMENKCKTQNVALGTSGPPKQEVNVPKAFVVSMKTVERRSTGNGPNMEWYDDLLPFTSDRQVRAKGRIRTINETYRIRKSQLRDSMSPRLLSNEASFTNADGKSRTQDNMLGHHGDWYNDFLPWTWSS